MGLLDWFFAFCAKRAFDQVDTNKNGKLDANEVELAILHVCNIVNKRLPGWQDPPTSEAIKSAVHTFGKGVGFLDQANFVDFAKTVVKNGPDALVKRMGSNAILTTAVLPGITHLVKKNAGNALRISGVPDVILSPAIGLLGGTIRGMLPFG